MLSYVYPLSLIFSIAILLGGFVHLSIFKESESLLIGLVMSAGGWRVSCQGCTGEGHRHQITSLKDRNGCVWIPLPLFNLLARFWFRTGNQLWGSWAQEGQGSQSTWRGTIAVAGRAGEADRAEVPDPCTLRCFLQPCAGAQRSSWVKSLLCFFINFKCIL